MASWAWTTDCGSAVRSRVAIGYVGPALIRRDAFEAVGGFDESMRLGEDLDLCLRLACAGSPFLTVDSAEALLLYRDTPGSLWRRSGQEPESVLAHLRSLDRGAVWLVEHQGRVPGPVAERLSYTCGLHLDTFKGQDAAVYGWLIARMRALKLRSAPAPSRWPVRVLTPILGYATVVQLAHWVHGIWSGVRDAGIDGLL